MKAIGFPIAILAGMFGDFTNEELKEIRYADYRNSIIFLLVLAMAMCLQSVLLSMVAGAVFVYNFFDWKKRQKKAAKKAAKKELKDLKKKAEKENKNDR